LVVAVVRTLDIHTLDQGVEQVQSPWTGAQYCSSPALAEAEAGMASAVLRRRRPSVAPARAAMPTDDHPSVSLVFLLQHCLVLQLLQVRVARALRPWRVPPETDTVAAPLFTRTPIFTGLALVREVMLVERRTASTLRLVEVVGAAVGGAAVVVAQQARMLAIPGLAARQWWT